MVFESSNTKLIFGMWKFKNTQKKKKKQTETHSCTQKKSTLSINPFSPFSYSTKNQGKKKNKKNSQISNKANGTHGKIDDPAKKAEWR